MRVLALGALCANLGDALGIQVISCFLGTPSCCPGECCSRAVRNCSNPEAPLLLLADFPGALGNIVQSLHDSLILSKVLGRSLVMPPVLGRSSAVDLGALAEAFGVDVIVAKDLHWASTCQDGGEHLHAFEVSGARSGPFRDHMLALARGGLLPLFVGLHETPRYQSVGRWSYERRVWGDVAYSGQWWGVRYPKKLRVQYWERSLSQMALAGEPCEDWTFLAPDLPRPLAVLQALRQHHCLEKALARQRQRCLVVMSLANSVHLGDHWQDHLLFFRSFSFVEEVKQHAASLAPGGHSKGLRRPYLAIHMRPYLFRSEGLNESAIASIFHWEVLHAVRRLQRHRMGLRDVFLASESTEELNTQRVTQLLKNLNLRVVSSEDTKPRPGGPSSAHVATDVTLCVEADSFLGTGTSSLSALIGSMRFARGRESSFIPRPRVEFEEVQTDFFPLLASLPSEEVLSSFFRELEARVTAHSPRTRAFCSADQMRRGDAGLPRYRSGHFLHDTVLPFGETRWGARPATFEFCGHVWEETAWSCPPVAAIAHMQLLVGLQNASLGHPLGGFPALSEPELYMEKVRFVCKLWHLLSIGLDFAKQVLSGSPP
ncbi:unnamed protein product [Effrenium voratum]|uniref:O-fucosyltransferase family protein n=1 Tax=Effrenium voratum TaxID=2562239 RepID=A0AA36N0L4_9DINO|nr:unnamed protein product [Effrenium voratum]